MRKFMLLTYQKLVFNSHKIMLIENNSSMRITANWGRSTANNQTQVPISKKPEKGM